MTISQMIEELKEAQAICGDVPVIFATDDEGNAFFNLDEMNRNDYLDAVVYYPQTICGSVEECITNLKEEKKK